MNLFRNILFALMLGTSFVGIAGIYGCPDTGDGPAEEAGEEIDDAAEDVRDETTEDAAD